MVESVITYFALPLVTISILLVFVRLAKGPSVEDRIVALDLLTAVGIGFLSLYALKTNSVSILDVGIILALLAFLGTVAFAFYVGRRSKK